MNVIDVHVLTQAGEPNDSVQYFNPADVLSHERWCDVNENVVTEMNSPLPVPQTASVTASVLVQGACHIFRRCLP